MVSLNSRSLNGRLGAFEEFTHTRRSGKTPGLAEGTLVRVLDSCRSAELRGQVGTVVAWGRQVDVALQNEDGSEGEVRKVNPPDLMAVDGDLDTFLYEAPEPVAVKSVPSGGRRGGGRPPKKSADRTSRGDEDRGGRRRGGRGLNGGLAPLPSEWEDSLEAWTAAKEMGDFETSDRIRSEMREAGFDPDSYRRAQTGQIRGQGGREGRGEGGGEGGGEGRRRRTARPNKEVNQASAELPVGGWVRVGDTCRSAELRGQVGEVLAIGRQVEVLLNLIDGGEWQCKLNPNDLQYVGMVPPAA